MLVSPVQSNKLLCFNKNMSKPTYTFELINNKKATHINADTRWVQVNKFFVWHNHRAAAVRDFSQSLFASTFWRSSWFYCNWGENTPKYPAFLNFACLFNFSLVESKLCGFLQGFTEWPRESLSQRQLPFWWWQVNGVEWPWILLTGQSWLAQAPHGATPAPGQGSWLDRVSVGGSVARLATKARYSWIRQNMRIIRWLFTFQTPWLFSCA